MEVQTQKQKPVDSTGEIALMGSDGDSKHYWNKNAPVEVKIASKVFKRYIKLGYRAYSMTPKGDEGDPVFTFNPSASCLLFVPPFAGG